MFSVAQQPLGNLIGRQESSNDYSAYNYFDEKKRIRARYDSDLCQMSLKEVVQAQKAKKMYAVGRYQIIPVVLLDAIKYLKMHPELLFSEGVQDYIFDKYLIAAKRPRIMAYITGGVDRAAARLDLAREWASMPVQAGTRLHNGVIARGGESYYSGDGRNTAHITEIEVDSALDATRQSYKNHNTKVR